MPIQIFSVLIEITFIQLYTNAECENADVYLKIFPCAVLITILHIAEAKGCARISYFARDGTNKPSC